MKIVKIFFRIIVALFIVFGLFMVLWKGTSCAVDYIFERHPDYFGYFADILVGLIMIVIGKTTIKHFFCDKN